jgi:hypothetical protein
MTSQGKNPLPSTGQPITANPHPSSAAVVRSELPIFRFGLRHLLSFFAVLSTLLTVIVSSPGATAVAVLLLALVVVAHLFSTALGSQLRRHANRAIEQSPGRGSDGDVKKAIAYSSSDFAAIRPPLPRSPWHGRGSTPLPWRPRLVVATAILGGAMSTLFLATMFDQHASPAGIAVGAVSVAVLGGWFAFVGSSFYGIVRHGFRDAMAEQRGDQARHSGK